MKKLLGLVLGLALSFGTQAAPVTLEFSASGFQNGGTSYPGFDGPVTGRISWNQVNAGDPISALTDIDLTIGGHTYGLAEVGVASNNSLWSAIGGVANGANTVVGSGEFHDFLLIFNRVNPEVSNFAYSIQGKSGAIWWFPTNTEARFVSNQVPEPASVLLVLVAGLGLLVARRGRQ